MLLTLYKVIKIKDINNSVAVHLTRRINAFAYSCDWLSIHISFAYSNY